MKKVYFKTFGCRTNIYDTQIMQNNLKDFILTQDESQADIIVVNSCTVTNGADSSVRAYINHVNKLGKRAILAGCGAFSQGEKLRLEGKVFGVLGHSKKEELNSLLLSENRFFSLGDLDFIDKDIVVDYKGKKKAFLKIQEGCDFACSYCIIPHVRGKARSQDEKAIIEQINMLSDKGYKEFVLTGTNIGSYGKDKGTTLGKLLQKISKNPKIKRIRLGSIEPVQIDESFKEILDEPWLERHLHVALQHTSPKMLRLMRRRNQFKGDLELFNFLANKGFALGTDFIVAHPGESQEIWQEAYKNLQEFPLTHVHAFIYSPRGGTHSALMRLDIPGDVAKNRLHQLENLVNRKNLEFRNFHAKKSLLVHVESFKSGYFCGYDQYFNPMKIKSEENLLKSWINIDKYLIKEDGNEANI